MKVIISTRAIYPFHGNGGMETYYYNLAKHLVREGVETEIISSLTNTAGKTEYYDDIKYTFLPPNFNKKPLMSLWCRFFDLNVKKYLQRIDFDILHATAGIYPYIISKNRKKVIFQPFGLEWFKITKGLVKLYTYILNYRTDKLIFNHADAIASEGKANTQEIMSLFKVPREKIFTLPNGVDLSLIEECLANSEIHREDYGIQDADLVLVNVNKLIPHKGVHYLIDALEILNKNLNAKLILIGSGSQEQKLKEQIKRNKLQDKVIHFKSIPNEKIFAFYALADIAVTPTLYEGGCPPFVVLEAMAVGKPIVTTDIPQMQDAVKDGMNGFLVQPRNPKAISDAILTIYDKGLIREMGKNSREMVKEYDWNIIAKRAITKYEELIEE